MWEKVGERNREARPGAKRDRRGPKGQKNVSGRVIGWGKSQGTLTSQSKGEIRMVGKTLRV